MCWICLEEETDTGDNNLFSPCKCPRKVHPQCLARWQLQQAGRHEEKFCRFCNTNLTDWKSHLTPEELKPEVSKVQPIMVVYFEGQIHRIPVKQGDDGLTDFTTRIRWVGSCGWARGWHDEGSAGIQHGLHAMERTTS